MAERPVFLPQGNGKQLVREVSVPFTWHAGLAVSQKQKSIASLHESARAMLQVSSPLEVSTKSLDPVGQSLSAFRLSVRLGNRVIPLESAFQGSKVFEGGGPYLDLLEGDARSAKTDPRIRDSGRIVGFQFDGEFWPTEPLTAFYDWLYIRTVADRPALLNSLRTHDAFTDIEFNPKRSINCQAHSAALLNALLSRGALQQAISGKAAFLDVMKGSITRNGNEVQQSLF